MSPLTTQGGSYSCAPEASFFEEVMRRLVVFGGVGEDLPAAGSVLLRFFGCLLPSASSPCSGTTMRCSSFQSTSSPSSSSYLHVSVNIIT